MEQIHSPPHRSKASFETCFPELSDMPAQSQRNPFPGLRAFESDEEYLFFGREGQSEEILRRLRKNRFLAIVGTSGSGKSSLVRAGLLPYLYGGFMPGRGSHWRAAIFRPGSDPIGNLARALNTPSVLGSPDAIGDEAARSGILLEVTLRHSGLGLIEAVRLAGLPSRENILIIIDQFEELFRFAGIGAEARHEDDANAFVKLLLEAVTQTELPIYVAITMRSEFIGDCARFRDLPEAVTGSPYLIPWMTREQRRMAIEQPVARGPGKNLATAGRTHFERRR
jgi:energy-coupling factor transporter ATP-binding protein EcfA2